MYVNEEGKQIAYQPPQTISNPTTEDIIHKDIRIGTPVTAQQLDAWIERKCIWAEKDSKHTSRMRGMGQAFITAALRARIDPVYLAAHAAHETGWGTSKIVRIKNNWFGIGAYDRAPYELAKTYDSLHEGILIGAAWIAEHYTYNSYGQNTLYKMRFNPPDPSHQYATDIGWADKIANIMIGLGIPIAVSGTIGGITGNQYAMEFIQNAQYHQFTDPEQLRAAPRVAPGDPVDYYEEKEVSEYDIESVDRNAPQITPKTLEHIPNSYYEDDFSGLYHRKDNTSSYHFRIGDSRFVIPPTQIQVADTSDVTSTSFLRQKHPMRFQSGHSMKQVNLTLFFSDYKQINGYEVDGPDGEKYYMDGLRGLLAQSKLMPFLPIENELLNNIHDVWAVAVLSIHVDTVPEFPGCLKAELSLLEFDTQPFLNKPSMFYDMHFMWPLFRWHYQQKLNYRAASNDNLRWYGEGDNGCTFWYLDAETLQKADEEKANAKAEGRYNEGDWAWFDTFGSMFTEAHEDAVAGNRSTSFGKLFERFEMSEELSLISASASTSNQYNPMSLQLTGKPTFQYTGGGGTQFQLLFQCYDRKAIQELSQLKDHIEKLARQFRDEFVSSPLRVENNFINAMGVSAVMMEHLTVETIPNQPNTFYVSLVLSSFDATQYQNEKLTYLDESFNGYGTKTIENLPGYTQGTWDNFITAEVAAEKMLNQLELYPDLDLPTYTQVNRIIPIINTWRTNRGLSPMPITKLEVPAGGRFVDPDFFFSYPSVESLVQSVFEEDVNLEEVLGETVHQSMEQEETEISESLTKSGLNDINGVKEKLNDYTHWVRNQENYEKYFWLQAWEVNDDQLYSEPIKLLDSSTHSSVSYKKSFPLKDQIVRHYGEKQVARMLHDRVRYNKRGTMLRAFPTFVFVIIDEGEWINARKLWDNYYTYHAVADLSVVRDRKVPMDTAYIKLSNIYGVLDHATRQSFLPIDDPSLWQMVWSSFFSHLHESEINERNRVHETAQLMAGARIHLRMGYGSTASEIPPMFNGVIAEIRNGTTIDIVAQSDGHELTGLIGATPDDVNTLFNQGTTPNDLFRHYMISRNSNVAFAISQDQITDKYQSKYGIEHFGYIRQEDRPSIFKSLNVKKWFKSTGWNIDDYDVMKNIYSTVARVRVGSEDITTRHDSIEYYLQDNLDSMPTLKMYRQRELDIRSLGIPNSGLNIFSGNSTSHNVGERALDPENEELRYYRFLDMLKWYRKRRKGNGLRELRPATGEYGRDQVREMMYIFISKNPAVFQTDLTQSMQLIQRWKDELIIHQKEDSNITDQEVAEFEETMTAILNEVAPALPIGDMIHEEVKEGEQGEHRLKMFLHNKSPWDVFRTIERVSPGYVVYPHIHGFHYTLFFGKPTWDVQCNYILPDQEGSTSTTSSAPSQVTPLRQPHLTYKVRVTEMIDGDTFWVQEGVGEPFKVRLLLTDTPEIRSEQLYSQEALQYVSQLVLGKEVYLETDSSTYDNPENQEHHFRDRYGRLLAYVWVNDQMVNELLVKHGYAQIAFAERRKYADHMAEVESVARYYRTGIWSIHGYATGVGFNQDIVDQYEVDGEVTTTASIYGQDISDYRELTKPFQQCHIYSGYEDILSNNVKADGSRLFTAAVPLYTNDGTTGGLEALEPVWADYDIRSSFQKTEVIDTTVVMDWGLIPAWMEAAGTFIHNVASDNGTQTQRHAYRFASSAVAESFRDMYQGEIVVIGDPAVKPYDLMYVDDYYSRMHGTAEVGRVVHQFSMETGFITSIKPDLTVALKPYPERSEGETGWESEAAERSGTIARFVQYGTLASYVTSRHFKGAKAVQANYNALVAKNLAREVKMVKNLRAITNTSRAIRTVRNAWTGGTVLLSEISAVGAASGIGWPAVLFAGVIWFTGEQVLRWIENLFNPRARNIVKLFPLYRHGVPYVAGINGHKHLIPGWEDNGSGRPIRLDMEEYINENENERENARHRNTVEAEREARRAMVYQGGVLGGIPGGVPNNNLPSSITADPLAYLTNNYYGNSINSYALPITDESGATEAIDVRTSSPYGVPRGERHHNGVDLTMGMINKRKIDTNLIAMADGVVAFAGWTGENDYGNAIVLIHTLGSGDSVQEYYSFYGHIDNGGTYVQSGDRVRAGQYIARMGNTGKSTGTHLHFEIHRINATGYQNRPTRGADSIDWYTFLMTRSGSNQAHNYRKNVDTIDPVAFLKTNQAACLRPSEMIHPQAVGYLTNRGR